VHTPERLIAVPAILCAAICAANVHAAGSGAPSANNTALTAAGDQRYPAITTRRDYRSEKFGIGVNESLFSVKDDVNSDGHVDLSDAILCLQVVSGLLQDSINLAGDVNGDGKIGMAEAIYALRKTAGIVLLDACAEASLGAGASLNGYRPFPADNPWNQDVSQSQIDPNSSAIISFIGASKGLKADFGSGLWDGAPIGIPYIVVDGSQTKLSINYTAYGDESDPGPMPVPVSAPIEGGSGSDGDRHVLVFDRSVCMLYELYRAFPQSNGSWNADSGAVWDLKSNAMRPWGWTSSDAAGLPVFSGLARYDEVVSGEITHALRFTVPVTRKAYVAPASHWASTNTGTSAPPMGMRVRLKADVDIGNYPAQAQVVLRALKKYGMILADNGSSWFISGAPDEHWDNDQLQALANIHGQDLEVVKMDTIYTADPTGTAPGIENFTANPGSIDAGQSATLSWSTTNATRMFVSPEAGYVREGTSITVHPAATTTYTLTAEGPFGVATRMVIVNVGSTSQLSPGTSP
jgi:hypothetical protein